MTPVERPSSVLIVRSPISPAFMTLLWTTIVLYALSRVLQVHPGRVSMTWIVALHVFPPIIFALLHGAVLYRLRVILVFTAICLVIGTAIENLGVTTGFPFGRYYFTDVMGPKLFKVNIMLGAAYIGMGYLSWVVATIILRLQRASFKKRSTSAVPLLAAALMVSWDLAMDPIWSTVKHAWVWVNGGLYFGVPISNFFGWYLTVWLIYQLFELYLRKRCIKPNRSDSAFLSLAVLFYGISAAGNFLLLLPSSEPGVIADPSGRYWRLSTITSTTAAVTVITMGSFSILAWLTLKKEHENEQHSTAKERGIGSA